MKTQSEAAEIINVSIILAIFLAQLDSSMTLTGHEKVFFEDLRFTNLSAGAAPYID